MWKTGVCPKTDIFHIIKAILMIFYINQRPKKIVTLPQSPHYYFSPFFAPSLFFYVLRKNRALFDADEWCTHYFCMVFLYYLPQFHSVSIVFTLNIEAHNIKANWVLISFIHHFFTWNNTSCEIDTKRMCFWHEKLGQKNWINIFPSWFFLDTESISYWNKRC